MKNVGVFICNFNGKSWVVNCVESLKNQLFTDFDIYMVDNASTDNSVDFVLDKYGDKVGILKNAENLGGAGGFNRGINYGLEQKYKYIVLLDNDITLAPDAIKNMYQYMEEHPDVGIVGSKVMIMDNPEYIQDFGCKLDFKKYREFPQYKFYKENKTPKLWECDYVPTCAVMLRASVISSSGGMPVDNFIYYDDIELSYRIKQCGYKVIALGSSKVFHKGGFRKIEENTFTRYYFLRNRLHFFSKYITFEQIDNFIDVVLTEIYAQLFGFFIKNKKEHFWAINTAFHDYLNAKRGKASDNRIIKFTNIDTPFEKIFKEPNKKILIKIGKDFLEKNTNELFYILLGWFRIIQKKYPQKSFLTYIEDHCFNEEKFLSRWKSFITINKPDFCIPELRVTNESDEAFDFVLRLCRHIKNVEKNILPQIWVDPYGNAIDSLSTYYFARAYNLNEHFFIEKYKPLMEENIKSIKGSF